MTTTVKNLTFRSFNLGVDVSLMLCFTEPSDQLFNTHFPVAWKVTTLAATGPSKMNASWASDYAVCAAQVGVGSKVAAGNYSGIEPGQQSTLKIDKFQSPPVFYWTPPKPAGPPDSQIIRADNGTDSPETIGVGFITNRGNMQEEMFPTIVYPDVGVNKSVSGQFTPVCSAYLALNYSESQIVRSEVSKLKPLWSKDLSRLEKSHTTIWIIRKSDGSYTYQEKDGSLGDEVNITKSLDWYRGMTRVYRATLAFQSVNLVDSSLKRMTHKLLSKGYQVKLVAKDGDTSANVELVLPLNTSCNEAENEMMSVVQTLQHPPAIAIQKRGGEVLLVSAGNFSRWISVNPASIAWYHNKVHGEEESDAAVRVPEPKGQALIANNDGSANVNWAASGNGSIKGTFADLNIEDEGPGALTPNYGNTRIVNRKASTASLATSYA